MSAKRKNTPGRLKAIEDRYSFSMVVRMNTQSAVLLTSAGAAVGIGAALLIAGARDAHAMRASDFVPLAGTLMAPEPACCSPATTIDQVAQLMRHAKCEALVVIDTVGRPIGIITETDLVDRIVAEGKNPMAHIAQQSMTQAVVTVGVEWPLDAIIETMQKHRIRHVPVVDDGDTCVGIVTRSDIERFLSPTASSSRRVRGRSASFHR